MSLIARLNNEGVQQLESGNWQGAFSSINAALKTLEPQLPLDPEVQVLIAASNGASRSLSSLFSDNLDSPQHRYNGSVTTTITSFPTDHNTVVVCPILFLVSITESPQVTPTVTAHEQQQRNDRTAILTAALIYNLGFAHHVCEMVRRYEGNQRHQEAITMARTASVYRMAATAAQRAPSLFSERHPLLMAIFNNCAHVSFQLMDMTTCGQCEQMLRFILSLPSPAPPPPLLLPFPEADAQPTMVSSTSFSSPSSSSSQSLVTTEETSTVEEMEQERQRQQEATVIANLFVLQNRGYSAPSA